MSFDFIRIVEAAYAVERPDKAWLTGVLDAARPALDAGRGVVAYFYDAAVRPIEPWGFVGDYEMSDAEIVSTLKSADDTYIDSSYLVLAFGSASEVPGFDRQPSFRRYMHRYGVYDAVALNALDTGGIGCWVGALQPAVRLVTDAEREPWTRVAAHLATALRLRRALDAAGVRHSPDQYADLILTPRGSVEHGKTNGRDVDAHREAIATAARALERARGAQRRTDPDGALFSWKALVKARWSLIDHFESDGRRYLLACSNDPASHGPDLLTTRERQVAAHVMLGHSSKAIAYELGLAHSTVRVHLARAARKLGVTSRDAFIRRYREYLNASGG